MLALAQKVGKQTAHEMVYAAAMAAFEAGQPLKAAILDDAQIMAHLSVDDVEALFDYRRQIGLCPAFVDRVSHSTRTGRQTDELFLQSV